MKERKEWIDSLKGICCLIVMLAHNVALILPALFFGQQVETSRAYEYLICKSPLSVLWNGSAMVVVFFLLSGMLLNHTIKKKTYLSIAVNNYIKLLPMVAMSILLTYGVMKLKMVYSLPLCDYSHSTVYAQLYNDFSPTVLGENGFLFDIFVRTFLKTSKYVNVLWYISALFISTLTVAAVGKILYKIGNKALEIIGWIVLFLFFAFIGKRFMWGLEYATAMIVGVCIDNGYLHAEKIKRPIKVLLIVLSVYVLSIDGSLLKYIKLESFRVLEYVAAATVIVVMIDSDEKIQQMLNVKWLSKTGKLSFAIYAAHWPVAISVSSGIALLLARFVPYGVAGTAGILCGMVVAYGVANLFQTIYKPCYAGLNKLHNRV